MCVFLCANETSLQIGWLWNLLVNIYFHLIHSFYSMQRSIHKDNHNHFFVSVKSIAFFSHVSYFEYESLAIAINKSLTSHRNIYMYIDNQN